MLESGTRLGRYRVVAKIGAGGMGEVYRARDETLDRDVAVKVLPVGHLADEETRQRFRREALALSQLNHPSIATVHDFGSEAGRDYLVMEFIEGPTLQDHLGSGPAGEAEVLRLGLQIADALAEAHAAGIVHRDLKPGNVKLDGRGNAKVLDFGLARLFQAITEDAPTQPLTEAHTVAGTAPYMSPEQLKALPCGPPSDVWSLGVVLYESVSGRKPFTGNSIFELTSSILQAETLPLPASVSPGLRSVIGRCLAKEPGQRYPHAGEARAALQMVGTGTLDVPVAPAAPAPSRRGMLAALAVAAAVSAAGLLLALWPPSPNRMGSASSGLSVVALPTAVEGGDDDQFLADAVPRVISARLSAVPELLTRVPPTSVEYAGLGGSLRGVAAAYDVSAYVVSSITTRPPDELLLSVQVVDAGTGAVRWGGDFEGTRSAFLDLAGRAADGLAGSLQPGRAATLPEPPTAPRNDQAVLALQQGLYRLNAYYTSGLESDYDRAGVAFNAAMELDPGMGDAAAGIAQLHLLGLVRGDDPEAAFARAETWARKAIQVQADCSQGWTLLSGIEDLRPGGDRLQALRHALKAVALDPRNGYAHVALANSVSHTAYGLGAAAYAEAHRLNPLNLSAAAAAASMRAGLGETEAARLEMDRVLQVQPDLPYALLTRTLLMSHADESGALQDDLHRLAEMNAQGRLTPGMLEFARNMVAARHSGDPAAMGRLTALALGEPPVFVFWDRATILVPVLLARKGQPEEALDLMAQRQARKIILPFDILARHPGLALLHGRPEFTRLLATAREDFQATLQLLDGVRLRGDLPGYLLEPLEVSKALLNPGTRAR